MAKSSSTKPSFVPYEKMTLSTNIWGESPRLDGIKKWVALEKIHGANFSFTVACPSGKDGILEAATKTASAVSRVGKPTEFMNVWVARRGDYLREGENFFGVTKQRKFLEGEKEKAKCVCAMVREKMESDSQKIESVIVFGELFGGYYPHPSVTQCPGVSNVQKEVVYCPDLKFCAFDIAITTYSEQEQSRQYLDYDICEEIFNKSGFLYAEPLATGTLQDMINFPLGFESKLPPKFGLPSLDKPNVAEGIVIKPVKNVVLDTKKGPKRVIFKRKVEGFAEVKPRGRERGNKKQAAPSEVWTSTNAQDFELLRYEMLALITTQRTVNVISKLGLPSLSPSPTEGKDSNSQDVSQESKEATGVKEKQSGVPMEAESGVQWKAIIRGLMKDVIEELETDHTELWGSCQRDQDKIGEIMAELREQCTQCVKEYKKTL